MKINIIKKLAESESLENLIKSEEEILNEQEPTLSTVEGSDLGEKLTHVIAAIWIKKEMTKSEISLKDAIRQYTQKVRKSIS